MRGYRGFTRSGNGKRNKSGARLRRVMERAERDGWASRAGKSHTKYMRWEKSFRNVLVLEDGATYWAMDRPQLLHKGRKP